MPPPLSLTHPPSSPGGQRSCLGKRSDSRYQKRSPARCQRRAAPKPAEAEGTFAHSTRQAALVPQEWRPGRPLGRPSTLGLVTASVSTNSFPCMPTCPLLPPVPLPRLLPCSKNKACPPHPGPPTRQ